MNGEQAKAAIYSGESICCTKVEYERDVRVALEDHAHRCKDVGDEKQERFAKAEIRRLDRKHTYGISSRIS